MTDPIRLVVAGPGALTFPSRKVTVEGDPMAPADTQWAKPRQRLSVAPGEYPLPGFPGSKLIVDADNNWGVNRFHSLLRSVFGLPELVRDVVVKDRLNIRVGYRPSMTGISGTYSREKNEIQMPRQMGVADNLPLAIDGYVDHMVESGQVQLTRNDDGRVVEPEEAKTNLKELFRAMAGVEPDKMLGMFPEVMHDPVKHLSPSRSFPRLLGYQFRFLMRNALPTAELTDINDRYLAGRRKFLADLRRHYKFPKGTFDEVMTQFDIDCQGAQPAQLKDMLGRFRAAIIPKIDPAMPPHHQQRLLQQLYEGTQIEVLAELIGLTLHRHQVQSDPGTFTKRMANPRAWVAKPFRSLYGFLRRDVLADAGVMKQIAQHQPPTT